MSNLILEKEKFPADIGGGLENNLCWDVVGGLGKCSIAFANNRRLKKAESERFKKKLQELTGMNWEVDSVSRWVFHCEGENIMAKKKQMKLSEENVQASEDEAEVKTAFPKIAAKAKIRSITREIDLVKVKFKDLTFTTGQEKQLAEWMDNEDELLVTVTLYQARLM